MSFKYKLILTFLIIEVIFITLIVGINFLTIEKFSKESTQKNISTTRILLKELVTVPISVYDLATLDAIIIDTKSIENIKYIIFFDKRNKIISSNFNNTFISLNEIKNIKKDIFIRDNKNKLFVTYNSIFNDTIKVGHMLIFFDTTKEQKLIYTNQQYTYAIIILELLLSIVIAYLLGNSLTIKLLSLTSVAEKIGKNIITDVPYTSNKDEISILASSINLMQNAIIERNKDLILFSKLFENTQEAIAVTDNKGIIQSVNKSLISITGYDENELIGFSTNIFKSEKHTREFYKIMWNSISINGHWSDEIINKKKDGQLFNVILNINSIKDYGGNIINYVGIWTDITLLKEKEKQLIDITNRFQLAIDGSNDGLWDWNIITNEVYFSPRWKSMLGYKENEIKNTLDEWSSRVHPDDVNKAFEDVQKHMDGKTDIYSNEQRMKHKDGSWIWILDRGKALFDENKQAIRFVGFHTDITEKKNYENNLEKLVDEKTQENIKQFQLLQQQNKLASMGEMVGAIAHQWRQPLNTIALELQFLEDDYDDELINKNYIKEFTVRNMHSVNFMSKTIDDFRNFFTQDKAKTSFGIKNKINEIMNILSPQMKNHNISMELTGDDFSVLGLQGEFQQVILNILNNAKDAIVENNIENAYVNINTSKKDNKGIIEIYDNAGGIPPEVITRVFEPYFTTKEQGKGTGLGLYMSKTIIDNNFLGELDVSNIKDGAKFTLTFNDITE